MVHAPHVAEIGKELILTLVDDGLECGFSLVPFPLIELSLAEDAESGTTCGATHVGCGILAALRKHCGCILEFLLDKLIAFLLGRTGESLNRLCILEHQGNAAEVADEVEIEESTEETHLSRALVAQCLVHVGCRNPFQSEVAGCDALIACAPEVLEDTAVLSVGHEVGDVLIAVVLGGVAVPEVVGGHVGEEPCIVDLPPSAALGNLEIAAAYVGVHLLFA